MYLAGVRRVNGTVHRSDESQLTRENAASWKKLSEPSIQIKPFPLSLKNIIIIRGSDKFVRIIEVSDYADFNMKDLRAFADILSE